MSGGKFEPPKRPPVRTPLTSFRRSLLAAQVGAAVVEAHRRMAVHVCPEKDIVCGTRPENWCAACPLKGIA